MTSPIEGRSFLDIKASVETHKQVMPDLLAAHALTGCDTVASPHDIGKMTALKVLRSQKCGLDQVGLAQHGQPLTIAAEKQSVAFVLHATAKEAVGSLLKLDKRPGRTKLLNGEVLLHRCLHCHQLTRLSDRITFMVSCRSPSGCMHWIFIHQILMSHCMDGHDVKERIHCSTVPDGVALIPGELIQFIKCSCQAERPCRTQRCSCRNANLWCSTFCSCKDEAPFDWRLTLHNSIEMSTHYVSFQRKICSK